MKKNKIISIMLYVISVLLFIYFLYAMYVAFDYIGTLMAQGQIKLGSSFGQVMQYMVTNTIAYLFYAIVLACLGYFVSSMKKDMPVTISEIKEELNVTDSDTIGELNNTEV